MFFFYIQTQVAWNNMPQSSLNIEYLYKKYDGKMRKSYNGLPEKWQSINPSLYISFVSAPIVQLARYVSECLIIYVHSVRVSDERTPAVYNELGKIKENHLVLLFSFIAYCPANGVAYLTAFSECWIWLATVDWVNWISRLKRIGKLMRQKIVHT